jgi:hypothetical protein
MNRITLWGLAPVMVLELFGASQPLLSRQTAASILTPAEYKLGTL